MNDKTILKSVALLTLLLETIDELEKNQYFYKNNLKMKGNNFRKSLEQNIKELYDNMPETAQIGYFNAIREIENKINNIDYAGPTETNL
jgi:hypothetical protein